MRDLNQKNISLLLVGLCLVLAGCDPDHDRVRFSNKNSSGEVGILLDGNVDGANTNDKSYTTTAGGHVDPGDVTSGTSNEIISYQQERPVAVMESVGWSNGINDILAPFANEMGADFYVWLLEGPYADRRVQAIAACIKLDEIWHNERMGIQIAGFQINDKTADPDRTPFLDFRCGDDVVDMRNNIGFNSNGVNIYYVDRVDFGSGYATSNGVWCGNNTVVMGRNASDHLAAHEIGHAFELDHVNALTTNFDVTNVMHNASSSREYLTEGQNFRAHLEPNSVINATYNLRPGLLTRNCANLSQTATNTCPAIQKRIWADGSFPAN